MRMYFLLLIIAAVILEVCADTFFKVWAINNRSLLLWSGLGFYAIGTFIWAWSLKYGALSKAISLFEVLNLLAVVLIGLLYFKEDLSMYSKIGIVLGIVSVVLLQL